MMILLWRLGYNIWLVGIAAMWLITLSNLIFARGAWRRKLIKFGKAIALSFVWPLALLTPQGRKILRLNTKEVVL